MLGLISTLLLGALTPLAQPPAAPPEAVCLTNACSDPLKDLTKARTVRDAITAGDGLRARELGGSPTDVIEALRTKYGAQRIGGELENFADLSDGSRLAYVSHIGPGIRGRDGIEVPGLLSIERALPNGMVRNIMIMADGNLFVGGPHPPDPR